MYDDILMKYESFESAYQLNLLVYQANVVAKEKTLENCE